MKYQLLQVIHKQADRNTMKKKIRITLCLGIVAIGLIGAYLGAYTPFARGQQYISALRKAPSTKTVQGFEENFRAALDYPSPIGDEELTKFLASDIIGFVSQSEQPEAVSRELTRFIEQYIFKNNVRHLLSIARIRFVLWQRFGGEEDYVAAEKYLLRALEFGPDVPPILYNLFEIYVAKNNMHAALRIAEEIAVRWPSDVRVQEFITAARKQGVVL